MIALLCFVLTLLVSPFKSKSRLGAENAAVASENSIHLTRGHRRIRTRSSDDCNQPLGRPYAVRLLQAATAAGSRNPNTAASAQRPAAAHAAPSAAFALGRPRPVHLALSSLPPHSGCNEHRQARDCRTLASQGLYRLLAMEIT